MQTKAKSAWTPFQVCKQLAVLICATVAMASLSSTSPGIHSEGGVTAKATCPAVATGSGALNAPIDAPNAGSYATVQSDEHVVLVAKNSQMLKTIPGRLVSMKTARAYQYAAQMNARASIAPPTTAIAFEPQHEIVAGGLSTARTGLVAFEPNQAGGQVASP